MAETDHFLARWQGRRKAADVRRDAHLNRPDVVAGRLPDNRGEIDNTARGFTQRRQRYAVLGENSDFPFLFRLRDQEAEDSYETGVPSREGDRQTTRPSIHSRQLVDLHGQRRAFGAFFRDLIRGPLQPDTARRKREADSNFVRQLGSRQLYPTAGRTNVK